MTTGQLLALDDVDVYAGQCGLDGKPPEIPVEAPAPLWTPLQMDPSAREELPPKVRKRRRQIRRIAAILMFGGVLIGAAYGVTELVRSESEAIEHGPALNEGAAAATLANLQRLRPKLFPWFGKEPRGKHSGYCYEVHEGSQWCAYAWPAIDDGASRKAFFIDAKGTLFVCANQDLHYLDVAAPATDAARMVDGKLPPEGGHLGRDGQRWAAVE